MRVPEREREVRPRAALHGARPRDRHPARDPRPVADRVAPEQDDGPRDVLAAAAAPQARPLSLGRAQPVPRRHRRARRRRAARTCLPDSGEATCRSRSRSHPRRASAASAPRRATTASRAATRSSRAPSSRRRTPRSSRRTSRAPRSSRSGSIIPCEFGVPAAEARNTIALIGDSHAAHWRAALEIVAQQVKWRGISITRSGCPYTRAVARLDPAAAARPACAGTRRSRAGWPPTRRSARSSSSRTTTRPIVVKDPGQPVLGEDDRLLARVEGAAEVRQARHRHPRHAEVDAGHAELRPRRDGEAQERGHHLRALAQRCARPRRRRLRRGARPLQARQRRST